LTKEEQLAKTREEIDRGTKAIYEATFSFDDVFVKADIIVRNRGCWDLYEVKSSTSVKEHHWMTSRPVLRSHRVRAPVNKAYLVHINNGYVRDGDIVPEDLFVLQDISRIVREKQASIPEELTEMRAMLRGKVPEIDIGPHCEDPYPCDFMEHCWRHVPRIFRLLPAGAGDRSVGAVPAGSRQAAGCPARFSEPDAENAGRVFPGKEVARGSGEDPGVPQEGPVSGLLP